GARRPGRGSRTRTVPRSRPTPVVTRCRRCRTEARWPTAARPSARRRARRSRRGRDTEASRAPPRPPRSPSHDAGRRSGTPARRRRGRASRPPGGRRLGTRSTRPRRLAHRDGPRTARRVRRSAPAPGWAGPDRCTQTRRESGAREQRTRRGDPFLQLETSETLIRGTRATRGGPIQTATRKKGDWAPCGRPAAAPPPMVAKLPPLSAFIAAAVILSTATPAAAVDNSALPTPSLLSPSSATVLDAVPSFAWTPVTAADHYEFQIAADAGFNSPLLGSGADDFTTQNTRATLLKTIPNGTYYWRVRSVGKDGSVSPWTAGRSFRKAWTAAAALQSPAGGAGLSFGTDPLKLGWSPVPGAANYLVSVATAPALGSLAFHTADDPTGTPKVQASSLAISIALATGTYYWGVTPVDAEGNRGAPSPVASFSWSWPSTTTPTLTDLDSTDPEVFDPKFSWDPVAGAAKYEVEINSSSDFAPGSKVCCSSTTIATSLSPTTLLKDNVYYWRVRAYDPDGNAGVWNNGSPFTKTFDKTAPAGPVTGTAIKNLHM